jgi:hypothetical protein
MRLWMFSDLHYGRGVTFTPPDVPDADLCICAGDLAGTLRESVEWLAEHVLPWMRCVLVPGNHEYYRTSFVEELAAGSWTMMFWSLKGCEFSERPCGRITVSGRTRPRQWKPRSGASTITG